VAKFINVNYALVSYSVSTLINKSIYHLQTLRFKYFIHDQYVAAADSLKIQFLDSYLPRKKNHLKHHILSLIEPTSI